MKQAFLVYGTKKKRGSLSVDYMLQAIQASFSSQFFSKKNHVESLDICIEHQI
jgi:hypothetical protein